MRKQLIALALIAIASLVIAGCNKELVPAGTVNDNQGAASKDTSGAASSGNAAGDSTITGSLNQVDALGSELSDPELDKTGDYIDEIEW